MSILEAIGSVAETPSPSSSVQPRSRLRSSTRISQRFQDRMREEEKNDTDESSPLDRRASRRRSNRVPPTRLTLRGSSEEDNNAEHDDDDDNDTVDQDDHDQDDDDDQDREEEHRGRYSFRKRGSMKKPARFDQSLFDDVFRPMRRFQDTQSSRETRRRDRDRRDEKSMRRRSSRSRNKRRRLDDDDDDDDGAEIDELDYATDESDIEQIQRRIDEQERAEAAEAAAAVAAVKAMEEAPRHTRSTRYALRHRDHNESISPERNRTPEKDGAQGRERRTRSEQGKIRVKTETRGRDDDNEEDDEQDEDEDDGADGRRYYLRQRSNSDLHEQEEQNSRSFRRERAKQEQERRERERQRQRQRELEREEQRERERDRERERRRRARDELRSMQLARETAAQFAAEDNGPRYSLRDRSKAQRGSELPLSNDQTLSAYADFAKRQANRASQRGSSHLTSSGRRPSKSNRKRRSERRRRLSSSSSSSSSDDMYKYYDSDQGGMRTGVSKRKLPGHGDKKRADISPVEVDRSITWDSVGGLEKHIEALKEMVMLPLLYPEFYEKYNVTPPSGVLFYGPPGTGKTLLASALANSCTIDDDSPATQISLDASEVIEPRKPRNVTFYMRKGADCLSKWVGEAERQLRLLFEEAKRNQPSIIFFDEIDGLAPVRSAKQDQIHASIVSTLLALMDGMDARGRVVVIGATNRLDAIDPALRRPGRFDRELGFKLPNVVERKKMLAIHTKKWNPPLSEAFIQEIAQRTVGYCGADVKALCAEAALCSLRRVYPQVYGSQDKLLIHLDKIVVTRGDFTKAMKKITPASHRTVSSFAAPLPRGVRSLLDVSLAAILRKMAQQFPLFPLDPQAVDAMNKTDGPSALLTPQTRVTEDDDENEDDDIYAVMNHDDCDVCHGDEGELVCCDACPGAFHAACLPLDHAGPNQQSTDWFCPECNDSAKMESLLQAKHAKAQQRQARQMYTLPQLVGFPRVLITGVSGMGQEYVAAALLHVLEGLTHFSLDYPSLVADVHTHNAEEALIFRLNEAQKCLPCVIFLPQLDLWWENTTESMHIALKMMLMSMQIKANLPVLFLATTCSTTFDNLPESMLELFTHDKTVQRSSILWELSSVSNLKRTEHFRQAFAAFGAAPLPTKKRRRDEPLEVLPLAPVEKKAKREPTVEELERIREHDLHCLRELRIFLGQVLDYCSGQRNYSPFYHPVDPEAVPDYYLIIKNPMDLSTMRERLNDGDYTCFEQFLDDIQLIVRNANMFNPKRSATRHIAQAVGTMKDNILSFAHRFRKHQGYDLFSKCREITKRLHTNPAMYSEVPDTSYVPRSASKVSSRPQNKTPSRTSDRLRGIRAQDIATPDASSLLVHNEAIVDTGSGESRSITGEQDAVQQWFVPKTERVHTQGRDDEIIDATDSADASDANGSSEVQVFEQGDTVFVLPRTFPGMNKLGGAGKVLQRNDDGTYNVKYVLGGTDKNIDPMYVRDCTDETLKESVRNQRSHSAMSGKTIANASEEEPPKTTAQIQQEFFDNLVWPILVDEGWTREEMVDMSGEGTTPVVAVFVPPPSDHGTERVTCEGIDQVLDFINKDRALAIKCFGKRYAEELPTQSVFGDTNPDTQKGDCNEATGDAVSPVLETSKTSDTQVPMPEIGDQRLAIREDEQENIPREFIYDEARMTKALDELIDKTVGWTVGELRDELLLLNKLAYPFRYEYDRTKLMEDVEAHIAALAR